MNKQKIRKYTIAISADVHNKIKVIAAQRRVKLSDLVEECLNNID